MAYEHIVAPATTDAKNVMPRVAALLDVMVISDASGVVDGSTFERPIYAGNAIQTVKSNDAKKVVTIRTATFDAAGEGGSAAVETISVGDNPGLSSWVEDKVAESDRPELTSAGIVVSGGRGVGSEEDFKLIETLADKLGAAVGASRRRRLGLCAERLAGGSDRQGCGAGPLCRCRHLGAIQHLAGMKDSKVIVAINKDEEAPIFQVRNRIERRLERTLAIRIATAQNDHVDMGDDISDQPGNCRTHQQQDDRIRVYPVDQDRSTRGDRNEHNRNPGRVVLAVQFPKGREGLPIPGHTEQHTWNRCQRCVHGGTGCREGRQRQEHQTGFTKHGTNIIIMRQGGTRQSLCRNVQNRAQAVHHVHRQDDGCAYDHGSRDVAFRVFRFRDKRADKLQSDKPPE